MLGFMSRADVWLDGALVPCDEARVSVLSHAIQRGGLVFDVGRLRLRETGEGRAVFFRPREHIERLLRSAEIVGLAVRWDAATLLAATQETAQASLARDAGDALVRWSAFVPSIEADVVPRPSAAASVAIAVISPEDTVSPGTVASQRPASVRVLVPGDVRKAGPDVFPPQAKVAASYLGPMLAKRRALAAGFDEVVLLDAEGRVAEAPTANVFVCKGGEIATPPLDRVLAGVTRDSVLAVARAEGIRARERHLEPEELLDADEAFLTASSMPVQAIASFTLAAEPDRRGREHELRAGAPGPLTSRLRRIMQACERGADERFGHWTVPV
jgi:branched-chain amino acid aminotransferase